jgi:heme-degrading monooxygenase HmoA
MNKKGKEVIMSNNSTVTEVVKFKTIDGVSDDQLINIVDNLDANYLREVKGYLDTELIKEKEAQAWTIIIHWRNMAEASEAIKNFPESPLTEEYRMSLDPKSVDLYFTEQIWNWKAA